MSFDLAQQLHDADCNVYRPPEGLEFARDYLPIPATFVHLTWEQVRSQSIEAFEPGRGYTLLIPHNGIFATHTPAQYGGSEYYILESSTTVAGLTLVQHVRRVPVRKFILQRRDGRQVVRDVYGYAWCRECRALCVVGPERDPEPPRPPPWVR